MLENNKVTFSEFIEIIEARDKFGIILEMTEKGYLGFREKLKSLETDSLQTSTKVLILKFLSTFSKEFHLFNKFECDKRCFRFYVDTFLADIGSAPRKFYEESGSYSAYAILDYIDSYRAFDPLEEME